MLQTHTVRPELLATLRELMKIEELQNFYLVGGTGLALFYGHRDSVDIDLFTHDEFDVLSIQDILIDHFKESVQITGSSKIMLFTYIQDIKTDFVNNRTGLLYPIELYEGIRIANDLDIATLKLKAIFQRGSKKDFIDLYYLLKHYSVGELVKDFGLKFPNIDIGQLLLSMQYFGDAEDQLMPLVHEKITWAKVKAAIAKIIIEYIKSDEE